MGVHQRSGVLTGERGCWQEKRGAPEKQGAPEKRGADRRSGVLLGELGCPRRTKVHQKSGVQQENWGAARWTGVHQENQDAEGRTAVHQRAGVLTGEAGCTRRSWCWQEKWGTPENRGAVRGEAGCREARRSPAPPAPGRTLPPQRRGPGAGAGRRARCSPLFPPSFHLQLYNCPPPLPALPPRRMWRCEGKSSRRGAARRSSTPSPSPGRPPLPAQVGAAPGGMGRGGQGLAPRPRGALSPKQLHRAQGGGCPAATCGDSPGEGR